MTLERSSPDKLVKSNGFDVTASAFDCNPPALEKGIADQGYTQSPRTNRPENNTRPPRRFGSLECQAISKKGGEMLKRIQVRFLRGFRSSTRGSSACFGLNGNQFLNGRDKCGGA